MTFPTPTTPQEFASYFDSTNLKLDATTGDIRNLCEEAKEHSFFSVMVYPSSVKLCQEVLSGSEVKIGTVIGFPSGRFSTAAKVADIAQAAQNGAHEVDMVMDYGALINKDLSAVAADVQACAKASHERGLLLKVIVETCFLTEEQILESLVICEDAQADFIKTSTGFGTAGATPENISLMARNRKTEIKIKAAGGMKNATDALAMIKNGATRLGASKAKAMLEEFTSGKILASSEGGDY